MAEKKLTKVRSFTEHLFKRGPDLDVTTPVKWEADVDAKVPYVQWFSWGFMGLCVVIPAIAIFILVVIVAFWDMDTSASSSHKFQLPFFWWVWFICAFAIAFVLWIITHIIHLFFDTGAAINRDTKGRSLGRKGLNAIYVKISGATFFAWSVFLLLFGLSWKLDDQCITPFAGGKIEFGAAYDQTQSNCVLFSKLTIALAIVGIGLVAIKATHAYFQIWNFFFMSAHDAMDKILAESENPTTPFKSRFRVQSNRFVQIAK